MSNPNEPTGRVRTMTFDQESRVVRSQMDAILDRAADAGRSNLLASEQREFDQLEKRMKELQPYIEAELADREEAARHRRERVEALTGVRGGGVAYTNPRDVYSPDGSRGSYFRDLYAVTRGDWDAAKRLNEQSYARGMTRALSTTNGAAGEFAPPAWLEDQFVALVRPGRVAADLCTRQDLPAGVEVLNVPKVQTGTQVAVQGTQNTQIQMTDMTTGAVSAPVVTIAGGQVVSQQLIDQSPLNVDQIVLQDLAADYARQLNSLVVAGTGTAGQLKGFANAGGQTITYTDASPTLGKLLSKIAGAIQAVTTTRYASPDAILMHPTRWAWCLAQLDTSGRPLVAAANSAQNAIAVATDLAGASGMVGQLAGLPVYLDATLPTNLGAGTNQDEIIVGRFKDSWLYESSLRAAAFPQTYAQNLSVLVRLYNYAALAHRYPGSLVTITGTGLTAATF